VFSLTTYQLEQCFDLFFQRSEFGHEGKGKVYNRSQSIVSEFLWREVNALDSLVMRPMGNKALIHTTIKIFEHQVYIRFYCILYSLRHTLYINSDHRGQDTCDQLSVTISDVNTITNTC